MQQFRSCCMLCLLLFVTVACSLRNSKEEVKEELMIQPIVDNEKQMSPAVVNQGDVPVVDLNIKTKAVSFNLQDVADVEYIPLETTNDILLESPLRMTLTENSILAYNRKEGSVFIFDKTGKLKHHFNHKGGSGEEYITCMQATFDESLREVYVVDDMRRQQVLVFDFDGTFKRKIGTPFIGIRDLMNINKDQLFFQDWEGMIGEPRDSLNQYRLLSKKTGEMRELPMTCGQLKSVLNLSKDTVFKAARSPIVSCMRNGQEIVVSDFASDTIFTFKDNELIPLLVKSPSIASMEIPLLVGPLLKTDRYLFLNMMTKTSDTQNPFGPMLHIVYDFHTGEHLKVSFSNTDHASSRNVNFINTSMYNEIPNCGVSFYMPDVLIEELAKGTLKGELKNISTTLKEDDNPILVLVKFNNSTAS